MEEAPLQNDTQGAGERTKSQMSQADPGAGAPGGHDRRKRARGEQQDFRPRTRAVRARLHGSSRARLREQQPREPRVEAAQVAVTGPCACGPWQLEEQEEEALVSEGRDRGDSARPRSQDRQTQTGRGPAVPGGTSLCAWPP